MQAPRSRAALQTHTLPEHQPLPEDMTLARAVAVQPDPVDSTFLREPLTGAPDNLLAGFLSCRNLISLALLIHPFQNVVIGSNHRHSAGGARLLVLFK